MSLNQSVLDRLIGIDHGNGHGLNEVQAFQQLKDSVRRDLEWLLNTRRSTPDLPEGFDEVENSLYQYGLPDIASLSLNSEKDHNRLLGMLDRTITTFEPRLKDVKVRLEPAIPGQSRTLHFSIHGLLRTEPAPARVSFDTVLELNSGQYQVQGEHRAR